jgi:hypothetical protein
VCASVLGLFGVGPVVRAYAQQVRCPVMFLPQEGDALHTRSSVEELFHSLGSAEKTLVASPGPHEAVPDSVVRAAIHFVVGHLLGVPVATRA